MLLCSCISISFNACEQYDFANCKAATQPQVEI